MESATQLELFRLALEQKLADDKEEARFVENTMRVPV